MNLFQTEFQNDTNIINRPELITIDHDLHKYNPINKDDNLWNDSVVDESILHKENELLNMLESMPVGGAYLFTRYYDVELKPDNTKRNKIKKSKSKSTDLLSGDDDVDEELESSSSEEETVKTKAKPIFTLLNPVQIINGQIVDIRDMSKKQSVLESSHVFANEDVEEEEGVDGEDGEEALGTSVNEVGIELCSDEDITSPSNKRQTKEKKKKKILPDDVEDTQFYSINYYSDSDDSREKANKKPKKVERRKSQFVMGSIRTTSFDAEETQTAIPTNVNMKGASSNTMLTDYDASSSDNDSDNSNDSSNSSDESESDSDTHSDSGSLLSKGSLNSVFSDEEDEEVEKKVRNVAKAVDDEDSSDTDSSTQQESTSDEEDEIYQDKSDEGKTLDETQELTVNNTLKEESSKITVSELPIVRNIQHEAVVVLLSELIDKVITTLERDLILEARSPDIATVMNSTVITPITPPISSNDSHIVDTLFDLLDSNRLTSELIESIISANTPKPSYTSTFSSTSMVDASGPMIYLEGTATGTPLSSERTGTAFPFLVSNVSTEATSISHDETNSNQSSSAANQTRIQPSNTPVSFQWLENMMTLYEDSSNRELSPKKTSNPRKRHHSFYLMQDTEALTIEASRTLCKCESENSISNMSNNSLDENDFNYLLDDLNSSSTKNNKQLIASTNVSGKFTTTSDSVTTKSTFTASSDDETNLFCTSAASRGDNRSAQKVQAINLNAQSNIEAFLAETNRDSGDEALEQFINYTNYVIPLFSSGTAENNPEETDLKIAPERPSLTRATSRAADMHRSRSFHHALSRTRSDSKDSISSGNKMPLASPSSTAQALQDIDALAIPVDSETEDDIQQAQPEEQEEENDDNDFPLFYSFDSNRTASSNLHSQSNQTLESKKPSDENLLSLLLPTEDIPVLRRDSSMHQLTSPFKVTESSAAESVNSGPPSFARGISRRDNSILRKEWDRATIQELLTTPGDLESQDDRDLRDNLIELHHLKSLYADIMTSTPRGSMLSTKRSNSVNSTNDSSEKKHPTEQFFSSPLCADPLLHPYLYPDVHAEEEDDEDDAEEEEKEVIPDNLADETKHELPTRPPLWQLTRSRALRGDDLQVQVHSEYSHIDDQTSATDAKTLTEELSPAFSGPAIIITPLKTSFVGSAQSDSSSIFSMSRKLKQPVYRFPKSGSIYPYYRKLQAHLLYDQIASVPSNTPNVTPKHSSTPLSASSRYSVTPSILSSTSNKRRVIRDKLIAWQEFVDAIKSCLLELFATPDSIPCFVVPESRETPLVEKQNMPNEQQTTSENSLSVDVSIQPVQTYTHNHSNVSSPKSMTGNNGDGSKVRPSTRLIPLISHTSHDKSSLPTLIKRSARGVPLQPGMLILQSEELFAYENHSVLSHSPSMSSIDTSSHTKSTGDAANHSITSRTQLSDTDISFPCATNGTVSDTSSLIPTSPVSVRSIPMIRTRSTPRQYLQKTNSIDDILLELSASHKAVSSESLLSRSHSVGSRSIGSRSVSLESSSSSLSSVSPTNQSSRAPPDRNALLKSAHASSFQRITPLPIPLHWIERMDEIAEEEEEEEYYYEHHCKETDKTFLYSLWRHHLPDITGHYEMSGQQFRSSSHEWYLQFLYDCNIHSILYEDIIYDFGTYLLAIQEYDMFYEQLTASSTSALWSYTLRQELCLAFLHALYELQTCLVSNTTATITSIQTYQTNKLLSLTKKKKNEQQKKEHDQRSFILTLLVDNRTQIHAILTYLFVSLGVRIEDILVPSTLSIVNIAMTILSPQHPHTINTNTASSTTGTTSANTSTTTTIQSVQDIHNLLRFVEYEFPPSSSLSS